MRRIVFRFRPANYKSPVPATDLMRRKKRDRRFGPENTSLMVRGFAGMVKPAGRLNCQRASQKTRYSSVTCGLRT
jgi:hypothetical protein